MLVAVSMFAFAAITLPAQAQVYKCQEGGKTVYSGTPCKALGTVGEEVSLREEKRAQAKAAEDERRAKAIENRERSMAISAEQHAKEHESRERAVGSPTSAAASDPRCTGAITGQDPVRNSGWDGSVWQVENYLKENLKDPDSFDAIEWSPIVRNCDGHMVRVKYRARNSFGGMVIEQQLFQMGHDGKVTGRLNLK